MHFNIKAVDASRAIVALDLQAADEADARRQLTLQGLKILSIRAGTQWRMGQGAGRIPLVTFSQELVSLLQAGLPLVQSIETLTEKETHAGNRRTLQMILARLYEGQTLGAALAEHPAIFPVLYCATVAASERSGALPEALTRYVAYQQQVDFLRKSLVNAAIYPLVVTCVGLLVMGFLMGYVVPRFSAIYTDLGHDLPFASRLLMQWGGLLDTHATAVVLTLLTALGLGGFALSRAGVRAAIGRTITRLPHIGHQVFLYQLSRLYRTVGMLIRGGMPVVTALEMSVGLIGANLQKALRRSITAISEGQSITSVLERNGLTTAVAARMLRVGERGGNMGEMMERIASFYDEELARWTAIVTRLIEPVLMSCIGIIIGTIVVLMYFPIFELAQTIQ